MKAKARLTTAPPISVDAFLAKLKHPLKPQIGELRRLMASVALEIVEEVKWNSVSFRTTESFATVNLRSTDRLQLVFHLGAKVRKNLPKLQLDDPAGLVKWLAPDRCLVTLACETDLRSQAEAFRKIVRAWLKYV